MTFQFNVIYVLSFRPCHHLTELFDCVLLWATFGKNCSMEMHFKSSSNDGGVNNLKIIDHSSLFCRIFLDKRNKNNNDDKPWQQIYHFTCFHKNFQLFSHSQSCLVEISFVYPLFVSLANNFLSTANKIIRLVFFTFQTLRCADK